MLVLPKGVRHIPGYLDRDAQEELVADIRAVVAAAPLFTPAMPRSGKEMSVRMTNCGALGWVTDRALGYRYQATHPVTGKPWPAIPARLLEVWDALSACPRPPEACLVNFYADTAKMGLHQDRDEVDLDAPIVSVSLGDSCLFRIGGTSRSDRSVSFRLDSGDVVVFGGPSRLAFHGVDRIYPSTSALLKSGGRINLTLRRVGARQACAM
ncbi:MAG: alpha-ketoglutarate-dependent dioxygenase AlkB [Phyllobacteriaceae bacterium]|nr:alpha-ketoglutarate-dependent dioxygenase AlkB [Phyllobacteriaceae bacterium]